MKQVHRVNLLERAVLGLDDEEVDDEEESKRTASKYQAVEPVNVLHDQLSEERDEKVPQPVGSGSQRHTLGSVTSWVELCDDSPDQRSPGGSECDNEQAGKDDEDVSGSWGRSWVCVVEAEVTNKGVDHKAHELPCSTDHQGQTTTAFGGDPKTQESAASVDGSEDDLSNVRVRETGGGKNSGAVIEEKVGTGQLLASLKDDTEDSSVKHARTSEDLPPV